MRALRDRRGSTSVEYGLIASLVATVLVGALTVIATRSSAAFDLIAAHL
jgi:Flp pilus assembly pilin Flp